MPEFKIYYKVTGTGYTYVEADTLEQALEKEKNCSGNNWSYDLEDDLNWELDEKFTLSENTP